MNQNNNINETNTQIKIGSILSYLQMGVNIAVSLIYTPMMIRILGKSEYGLYSTVASTISMLSILSLGFGSGYIRFYSQYKAKNDYKSIDRLNGLMLTIYLVIGAIAFLCGLFLTNNLSYVFKDGLTLNELVLAKRLMLLLSINLAFTFPMSTFSHIISAHERFIFLKSVGIIKNVFSPLINIMLLMYGLGSVGLVTVTLIVNVTVDVVYLYYVVVKLKQKFCFRGLETGLFVSLFSYTGFIAINLIIDQINWNLDRFLLGRFCGTGVVAVYSVGATLFTYYQMFSTAISGIFTPRIHHMVNSNESESKKNKELTELFTKVGRIQYYILFLVLSGFVFWGKEFIFYWAGDGYDESYYVALLLMIPGTIDLIQNLGIEIQRAENKHRFRSFAYLIMAIINIVMSIYLCQLYGAQGAAFGTALSLLIANGFVINVYYYKECGLNIPFFWKSILKASLGFVIPIICGVCMCAVRGSLIKSGVLTLLLVIFIYCVCFVISIYYFSFDVTEKSYVNNQIKKLVRRHR